MVTRTTRGPQKTVRQTEKPLAERREVSASAWHRKSSRRGATPREYRKSQHASLLRPHSGASMQLLKRAPEYTDALMCLSSSWGWDPMPWAGLRAQRQHFMASYVQCNFPGDST
jgi:hypothetical protein